MGAVISTAFQYALLGWRIIPLRPKDKRPLLDDWPQKATADPLSVEQWWRRWPDANIGIATGAGSGIFVLDVDAAKDGYETLEQLQDQHGVLPTTIACQTGTGGLHLYFVYPSGLTIRNSAGRLGPGLDVRGDGGYVVAPPSTHPNGRRYEWLEGQDPWTQVLADPPDWLLRLIAQATPRQGDGDGNGGGRIPEGQRNVTLASIAGSLRRKGLDERAIGAALSVINSTTCDPPLPSAEVDTIAKSIARYDPDPQTNPAVRDLGHAEVLAMLFENRLRWCADWGRWLRWDGTRWAEATHEEVAREAAEELRRHYADQIATTSDKAKITDLTRCVLEACTFARVQGALSFLKGWPGVVTRAAELDADPWLLNVQNGTVDLRTGTLRPHDPADLITKRAEVTFPTADIGAWQQHVEMVLPNPNVRREVQRSLGLALVGEHLEERLDIWFGTGANGKSTTISALLAILGDYAIRAAPDLLVQSRYERHPTELADLQGRRLVFSVEVADGKRLAEALVKDLTGGDRLKARFMRQDFFEFKPTHSLFLACNAKPVITGQDMGIWRRLRLIPWEVTIPPDQQRPQADVLADLIVDGPAILRWLLEGLADWQRDHKWTAPEVQAATQQYRAEQDILGHFLAERCEIAPRFKVGVGELYEAYLEHCEAVGEEAVRKTTFGKLMRQRGFEQLRDDHERTRKWVGLRLRTNADKFSV
jgi:putative DNA primase/helicase